MPQTASKTATAGVAYLTLSGLTRPVALCDCDELVPVFARVLGTWPSAVSREPPAAAPVIRIERRGRCFVLTSPWAGPDLADDSGPGIVCSTLVDLATEFAIDNPALLGLHCGAVRFGDRLVLFPAATRSGKSTLVARLGAAGHRIWADDLLAIDPVAGTGRAFGILPRLRRPVPRAAGRALAAFVRARTGVSDHRQAYLALRPEELAGFGEACRLGAIVLPERVPDGPATLEPIGRGAAVERLLLQTLVQPGAASELMDRLAALAGTLPAFRLRYADLDAAAALLGATDWPQPGEPGPAPAPAEAPPPPAAVVAPGKGRFVRDPAARLREIDGERFLVSERAQGIFGLNPVAAGVWDLLEEPITEAEITDALAGLFTATDRRRIASDVRGLLRRLARDGLVVGG